MKSVYKIRPIFFKSENFTLIAISVFLQGAPHYSAGTSMLQAASTTLP
jgi:hypothetical protein